MIKVSLEQALHLYRKIKGDNYPDWHILSAVAEGNNVGKVWLDKIQNPEVFLVSTPVFHTIVSKKLTTPILEEIFNYIHDIKPVYVPWPREAPELSLKKFQREYVARRQFYLPQGYEHQVKQWIDSTPKNFQIRSVDRILFEQCQWKQRLCEFYVSIDAFMEKGLSCFLMNDNTIVSEAHAVYIGKEAVELAGSTHPDYRGQGFATMATAHLIHTFYHKGLVPVWGCDAANIASSKVAQKLGFIEDCYYNYCKLVSIHSEISVS